MDVAIAAADTAWVLAAMVAVAFMVPGLALFYGGMVSIRSTLNMMMMTIGAVAVMAVLWVLVGYSLTFGNSIGGVGLLGDPLEYLGLRGIMAEPETPGLPPALFAGFLLLFAGITVALVAGGVADRMRFSTWLVFAIVWPVLVFFPVAHWVFAFDSDDGSVTGGWIANNLGAIDLAGGTAIHINAGVATLALVLVLGRRAGFPTISRPHSVPLTFLGAGMLFAGWIGFNAGSAVAAGNTAAVAALNTVVAGLCGALAWMITEQVRAKHPTTLGVASGLVAGLVGITPAAAAVSPLGAIAIGLICGVVCHYAVGLKYRLGYDDSLDVAGLHMVAGIIGTLLIGVIADPASPVGEAGLLFGGGFGQLGAQTLATAAVLAYSFTVTLLIALVLDKTMGLRVTEEDELEGLDKAYHREMAYFQDGLEGDGLGTDAVVVAEEEESEAATASPPTSST
ncbi:ammonium transporter [Dietzia psychralcaliphila]|uniref:Ammonium transporter n=1 Tax=Dietzia psychralcaliphila TaxID=139021 RepID=A0AAD0NNP7_9ACTN|nr:ammonium transporter [Dietzia psychralcaliphila]AWH97060.1 ammonia channel protein [Dietzia psychralcaliphila]PTM87792.1 ammonium transporter [Dietzia psychralcaliphila]